MTDQRGDPLQAIADGLRQRVRELLQAEEQLAKFAFTESEGGPDRHAGDPSWDHFVGRILAVAGDDEAVALLRRLDEEGPATVATLGAWLDSERLAVVDRLNHLTHVGCVSRDLETDRVMATGLGLAVLQLVDEISRLAGSVPARA